MAYNIKGDLSVDRDLTVNRTLTVKSTAKFTHISVSADGASFSLPTSGGADREVLASDGAGQTYWTTVSGISQTRVVNSSELPFSAGGKIGFSHNLNELPDIVDFELINVSAELGYSQGDRVVVRQLNGGNTWSEIDTGLVFRYNTTTVSARIGAQGIDILNFSTGVVENVDETNWEIVIRAIKY